MAAIRNGAALDRSGSMVTSRAAIGPGATIHVPGVESSTSTPRSRRPCTVIAMCGSDGTGPSPMWRRCRPLSQRAPLSSRPETNCEDADESISTGPPAAPPRPRMVNGISPRPPSSTSAPAWRSPSNKVDMGRVRA